VSQANYLIPNSTGLTFRQNVNNALAAIASNNSGSAAPSSTFAFQWFVDTGDNKIKIRNLDNDGYIEVGDVTAANFGLAKLASPSFTGNVGIGTSAPNAVLEIRNSNAGDEVQRIEGSYAGSGSVVLTHWRRSGGAVAADIQYHDSSPIRMSLGTSTSHNFALKTSNTDRLTISNSGEITATERFNAGSSNLNNRAIVGYSGGSTAGTITANQYFVNGPVWQAYNSSINSSLATSTIFADGRMDLFGTLNLGGGYADATGGISAFSAGGLISARASSENLNYVFQGYLNGTGVTTNIDASGNATFSGRLLVGATTEGHPDADDLTLEASSGYTGITLRSGTTQGGAIYFSDATSGAAEYDGQILYSQNSQSMSFATAQSTRIVIDSSGNVGLGTSSFTATSSGRQILEINGASSALINLDVGGTRKAYHSTDGTDVFSYNVASGSYVFGTNDSERMRIDSSGNLLIHQSASTTPGTGNISVGASFESLGSTVGSALHLSRSNGPSLFLNANANTQVARFHASGTEVGSISVTGSATAFNTSSDYRLKENVVSLDDGITRLKQLSPKRFNFIASPEKTVDGFIAHEAQAVVPQAVSGTHNEVDDKGNAVMQQIDQSKLVPLLTAALQEAIAKIETLEAKVAALEAG
jgi:hypothetical protein